MPTRTINLKIVQGSNPDAAGLRQALWTTHKLVNDTVAVIERTLLLCRGQAYWTLNDHGDEIQVASEHVTAEALAMARTAQVRNGFAGKGSDGEVLAALRSLYEKLVPSCLLDKKGTPQTGDAQAANALVSPLMDPKSEGGLSVYDKVLDPPPAWIAQKNTDSPGWEPASVLWLESADSQRLQKAAGAPPAWVRKLRNNQPWQDAFIEDQEKKTRELRDGNAPVIRKLKELGLLPILSPPINTLLPPEKNRAISVWDRLAVRLAVAHLLSWESWNHTTRREHAAAREKLKQLSEEYTPLEQDLTALRKYESARHEILKKVAFADDERPFAIGVRTIRAWDQVRERWTATGRTEEDRMRILNEMQTRLRGKFGDPDLFRWLAAAGRERLWKERDSLSPLVKINTAKRLLEKRREYSLMTFADARRHPRWAMFEAPGGTNLREYDLGIEQGALRVSLPLLCRNDDGGWEEKTFTAKLAPSGQLAALAIEDCDNGKTLFRYRSAHQDHAGVPGGAEILFDRPHLENPERTDESLGKTPGRVWLKLTMDVQSQAPADWLDGKGRIATPPEAHHFKTALSNKSKHSDKLQPGLRVLSVDLGLRTFASCSVFELVQGMPKKGLAFPAADDRAIDAPDKLWARHVRSFKLALPGENPTRKEEEARKAAWEALRSLKGDMGRLRDILRLGVAEEDEKRGDLLDALRESLDRDTASALRGDVLTGLGARQFRSSRDLWRQHCEQYYDRAEKAVSKRFSLWRRTTRPRAASWSDWRDRRGYHGGKSAWMIEYLEAVRKLILSWNLRGRVHGQVNRQDKKRFGTVASTLLQHINQLKEDRTKTGADLVIQAARGFVPAGNGVGWEGRHAPCRLILFEDLARYRFRVDRPRRENSQLMKWSHREILAEAQLQSELYGMVVDTTAAGFSSRFLASNGAPGVRCRLLGETDFEDGLPKHYVAHELDWMLGNAKGRNVAETQAALAKTIRPGCWVPWSGGEMFASLRHDGRVHFIHADINAAQNLQRRLWGRCGEAFRLGCKETGMGYELETLPGARLLGALQQLEHGGCPFVLIPAVAAGTGAPPLFAMHPVGTKKLKSVSDKAKDPDEWEEALAELEEESGGGRETFFRDPSGVFFHHAHWVPSKIFWGQVKRKVWKALLHQNENQPGAILDDLPF